jgi:fructokinase
MIYALGESLMDIITTHDGVTTAKPGGSMLNVSVSLGRTGKEVSLISELGDDETGKQLIEFLHENRINTDLVTIYSKCETSKALALLDENSKPSYTFQKSYPSVRSLANPPVFTENDILILGSMYSRDREIKNDLDAYLIQAKRAGALIVYDPNVRHNHQLKKKASKKMLLKNLAFADIIKGSDEDFYNIFQLTSLVEIKNTIQRINRVALIFITSGEKGSSAFYKDMEQSIVPDKIKAVSTIGAGDAFTAGLVNAIIKQDLQTDIRQLSDDHMIKIMAEGTRFATLVCQSLENYIPWPEVI